MAARTLKGVTETELSVLKTLWEAGSSTIRQLTDVLYPGGAASHYATVQKLLDRLESKGYVSHRRVERINHYEPRLDRDALVADRLRQTADALCDGSWTPLMTQLLASGRISQADLDEMRRLLDRNDEEG